MEQSVKSLEVLNGDSQLEKQDSMNSRFARFVDRVRNLEVENRERCLKEAEDRLIEQHEIHANAILGLRRKYESQLKSNREEIEAVYATKIKAVQNDAQNNKAALAVSLKELKTAENRIDDNNAKIVVLEQINLSFHDRISDLQLALEKERSRSAKSHDNIDRLRKEISLHLEEDRQLMDVKESLAQEISLYEQLLSDAEKRMKSSKSVSGIRKRKSVDTHLM